ncbi:uncharacterized protein LOC143195693 [Rhynchophorus ferrugineus]|uniref:uncharacterized protein LOC143195693 n=1 Tax=Rhynchophorus ferrugineus TaxID=354439 RepID=UPI003FCCA24D
MEVNWRGDEGTGPGRYSVECGERGEMRQMSFTKICAHGSKYSLKVALLHIGNKKSSIPITHGIQTKLLYATDIDKKTTLSITTKETVPRILVNDRQEPFL